MGIFDIDDNIENIELSKGIKFKRVLDKLVDRSSTYIEEIFNLDGDLIKIVFNNPERQFIDTDSWIVKFYRKDSTGRWVQMFKDYLVGERCTISQDDTFEEFKTYLSNLHSYKVWDRWRKGKSPNRELWIKLFELTDEDIDFKDQCCEYI